MSKSYNEIAAELTLAIIDRIKPVDSTNPALANKSLAEEVALAYKLIYAAVKEASKIDIN